MIPMFAFPKSYSELEAKVSPPSPEAFKHKLDSPSSSSSAWFSCTRLGRDEENYQWVLLTAWAEVLVRSID